MQMKYKNTNEIQLNTIETKNTTITSLIIIWVSNL